MLAGLLMGGCAATYFVMLNRLRRMLAENQRESERRLAALTEAIRGRIGDSTDPATEAMSTGELDAQSERSALQGIATSRVDGPAPVPEEAEIPPPIQAAIAAAAIAMLGNHARVRSARRIPSSDVVSPWTQQGRVIVQSSHNLRTQGSR